MRLGTRLTVASAVAVAAAVLVASAVVLFIVRGELRGEVDQDLTRLAARVSARRTLSGQVVVPLPEDPFGGAAGYAQLVTADGSSPETLLIPVSPRARAVAAGTEEQFFDDVTVNGVHVRVLTTPVAPGAAVQVARPLDEVDSVLDRVTLLLGVIALAGIAVAALLGRLVARAALSPVRKLTEATEHVTTTRDLSRRLDRTGSDELGRMAGSFNAMLEALEESSETQRRLVADASHELRTPLTSLRTNVEVLSEADRLPPAEREQLLADVVAQLEELTEIVTDVMELARGNELRGEPEIVKLRDVASEAIERARRNSRNVNFTFTTDDSEAEVMPDRLGRAIGNLLDNAAKWSSSGDTIEVEVNGNEIRVRDRGPGIAEEDLPHIFDRFYRADGARGRPGSGLGLAIVKQVAETHGGSVRAEQAPGGGSIFTLTMPSPAVDESPPLTIP